MTFLHYAFNPMFDHTLIHKMYANVRAVYRQTLGINLLNHQGFFFFISTINFAMISQKGTSVRLDIQPVTKWS